MLDNKMLSFLYTHARTNLFEFLHKFFLRYTGLIEWHTFDFEVGKVRMSLEAEEKYSMISAAVVLSSYNYRRDKRKTRNRKLILNAQKDVHSTLKATF